MRDKLNQLIEVVFKKKERTKERIKDKQRDILGKLTKLCKLCGNEFYPLKQSHTVCLECYLPIDTDNINTNKHNILQRSIIGSRSLMLGVCQVCDIPLIAYIGKDIDNLVCNDCKEVISIDKYRQWKNKVFKRDEFTCQVCNQVGAGIEAHHIKSWKNFPELRYKISNGITLCKECHKDTNNWGGKVIPLTRNDEE